MKHMKKFLAFMLALTMMLAMSVTAMADDTYTVTINGVKEGHTYEAYQIFSGTLDSTGKILATIEWGTGINGEAFVKYLAEEDTGLFAEGDAPNIFAGVTTAEQVADALTAYTKNDEMLDIFAKAANDYLTHTCTSSTADTENGTTYTITGLAAGYYLIKDSDDTISNMKHDFYTKFMLTVVGNSTVSVKGSVPEVNKTVNDRLSGTYTESEDAQIGDTVYFKWEGTLPSNYDIYETYYYKFEDTLPNSLTFNKVEAVYVLQADGDEIAIASGNYTVTAPTSDSNVLTVEFVDLKASTMPTLALDDKIVVKYSAILNENAVIGKTGNQNSVVLIYDNNPYDEGHGEYGTTPEDIALVYTFEMDVDKVDAANNEVKLSGAKFVLYTRDFVVDTTDETSAQASEDKVVYTYVLIDENGKVNGTYTSDEYVVNSVTPKQIWLDTVEKAAKENPSIDLTAKAVVTSDEKGEIKVTGLDARTYRMLEIAAPDGYNLAHSPFVVIIEPVYDANGILTGLKYEVDTEDYVSADDNYGYIDVLIENGEGNVLPSTGGIGTTIFYVLGGVMVAGAVVLLVAKKRMNA